MTERLQNFIDGAWQPFHRRRDAERAEPGVRCGAGRGAALSRRGCRSRPRTAAARAFVGWRRTPVGDRIQPLFKLKSLLEANRDDLARTITDECGKTLARKQRRDSARHRERRDGMRHAHDDAGHQQRGHRRRHRRAHDSPAAGCGGRDHAVQLPGHDSVLVPALRGRRRQLLPPEAVRTRADDLAKALSADSRRRASRPA